MNGSDPPNPFTFILAAIAGFFLLSLVCRPTDPNAELARTAREAVELAHDADSAVTSAVLWSGRFRLLAIVVGVSVPMVVAFLIWRSSNPSECDPVELLDCLEQLGASRLGRLPRPDSSPKPLSSAEETDRDAGPQA